MFFSSNLALIPGDSLASVSAQAEDSQHKLYPLIIEFVGKTRQFDWLTQIVIRLPDELTASGDLRVSLHYRGAVSNKALISLRQPGN
jgi:hypothetical protein